jgi:predicted anti-sigma-YlaC factor YlaD
VNCKGLLRELSAYLDGELGSETLSEIQIHLERCKDCRVIVDTTRQTIQIYYNARPLPLPDDVRERLHQALRNRLGRRPFA